MVNFAFIWLHELAALCTIRDSGSTTTTTTAPVLFASRWNNGHLHLPTRFPLELMANQGDNKCDNTANLHTNKLDKNQKKTAITWK